VNRNQAERDLMAMGLSASLVGFDYILDALEEIFLGTDKPNMANLYAKIGDENDTEPGLVERGIRYAIRRYYKYNVYIPEELEPNKGESSLSNQEFLVRLRLLAKERWR